MTLQLDDLSLTARIGIGIMAVIAAIVLIVVCAVFEAEGQNRESAVKSPYDERIIQLDREAIETAYVEHMKKLFAIWVTDYSNDPPKAVKGAQNGRSAYIRAMTAIDKREAEVLPPP